MSLFLFVSCKENKQKERTVNSKSIENTPHINLEDNKILNFKFPDTVYAKIKTRGVLTYDLQLDSSISSKLTNRFVFLYVTTDFVEGGSKEIAKRKHSIYKDTIGDGNYIFEVTFEDKGANVLSLAIEDNLILKSEIDSIAIDYGVEETSIHYPVFVK